MKLTADRLRELLHYDSETGNFTRLVARKGHAKGEIAGCAVGRYTVIHLDGVDHYAHRLAWLYVTCEWPEETIDHIDRDTHNNRWANLREASVADQRQNSRLSRRNTSGHKGVSWDSRRRKWVASIGRDGRRHYIGRFERLEDAVAAYVKAKGHMHSFHPAV